MQESQSVCDAQDLQNSLLQENTRPKYGPHKLVLGFGGGLIYGMGRHNKWKQFLPKYVDHFKNDILISCIDIPGTCAEFLGEIMDSTQRLYMDSGGYSLYRTEQKYGVGDRLKKDCERIHRKFLRLLSILKPKECFELDNEIFRFEDDMLSTKNYLREEVKSIVGYYPTPVFKMHQGFAYWKQLCECDEYPRLAIGGLAQTRKWGTVGDEIKILVDYARYCKKKVHLLGCQNIETFKKAQPDTVDFSIYQLAINLAEARKEHPEWPEDIDPIVISKHAILWAFARAKVRTYFYDSYQVD